MIHDLRPYSAYKDSGVEWLGEMPEHWNFGKIRDVALIINGYPFDSSRFSISKGYPLIRIRDLNKSQTTFLFDGPFVETACVKPGEVLIGMDGDFNVGRWRGSDNGLLNQRMCCVRGHSPITTRFLLYLLPIPLKLINDVTWSTTVKHLASSQVERIQLGIPPEGEQSAIVHYLDYIDKRIRRYIHAKQKLIKLLEEEKQAIIHRAVTRGLDPDVKLKDSGVEWLGEIPESWDVGALRRYWEVVDCKHVTVPFVDEGIPLASVREVQSFDLDLSTSKRTTEEWYAHLIGGGRRPKKGDLIYCRNVSVGACSLVANDERFAMGQDVCLIRSESENGRFLNYFMHSPTMQQQLSLVLVGSTFNRINVSEIKSLLIAVPPRNEQDAIVSALDARLSTLNKPIELAQKEIFLLKEYRTRLIADVVTGKLDVREAAANLPEESEEIQIEEDFKEETTEEELEEDIIEDND